MVFIVLHELGLYSYLDSDPWDYHTLGLLAETTVSEEEDQPLKDPYF